MATSSAETPKTADGPELVARFAERVARRDELPPPAPLRFDADSVRQRLQAALRQRIPGLTTARRARLAYLCYCFLDIPVLDSQAISGTHTPRSSSRDWQQLTEAGLIERLHAGRQRCYRLSRAGEDWLLAVVQGTLPAQ